MRPTTVRPGARPFLGRPANTGDDGGGVDDPTASQRRPARRRLVSSQWFSTPCTFTTPYPVPTKIPGCYRCCISPHARLPTSTNSPFGRTVSNSLAPSASRARDLRCHRPRAPKSQHGLTQGGWSTLVNALRPTGSKGFCLTRALLLLLRICDLSAHAPPRLHRAARTCTGVGQRPAPQIAQRHAPSAAPRRGGPAAAADEAAAAARARSRAIARAQSASASSAPAAGGCTGIALAPGLWPVRFPR
jgi:hypothetical protein